MDEIVQQKKRGRPKKAPGERAADLPETIRAAKQIEREEAGQSWGVTDTADTGKYARSTLAMWELPVINIDDPAQVEERVHWYFRHCGELELKPSVAGLAVSLGVDRTTLYRWAKGELRNNSVHHNMIKRAVEMILYNTEIYAQDGKMNPAIAIFLLKNHGGYTDTQQITVEAKNNDIDAPAMADVMQEYAELEAPEA